MHRLDQGLRDVVAGGGAVRPPETDVEVRAVFVTLMAAAAKASTGAIGFREGAKQGAPGQAGKLAEEGLSGSLVFRNRHNRL